MSLDCTVAGNPLSPRRIGADDDLRIAFRAVDGQVGRDGAGMIEPDHGAAWRFRNHVVVDQRGARARHDGHADAGKGFPDHIADNGDVAQIFTPAGDDAERRRILDHIAGDRTVGFDIDADAGVVVRRGTDRPLRQQVADDVALDHGDPAAFVEVADGHPECRAIHRVVGHHGAFEGKFWINRDLADVAYTVAGDLDVRRRVAAHAGVVAIFDAIASDDDVAGAQGVDGVAVLPGAAGARFDVLDAVVRDQRAVVADRRAQDFDTVVAGACDAVARDDQAFRIERHDRRHRGVADDVAADIALDLFEPDRATAAADDLAIGDANVAAGEAVDQPAPGR